jgi:3-oxoacyl-[acyl-carrier protein] reductase
MRRALVTGGSGAIGAAICRKLAEDGLHVYVHAHKAAGRGEAVVAEILAKGGSATAVSFDVTDADAVAVALQRILGDGPIQVLVNNAGLHDDAVMPAMRHSQWSSVIDVSLGGFFNVTQPLLMPMIGTRWGRIIAITSISGLVGNRGQVNYAAAKSGLHGATKSLSLELASRGITVNAIAPGIIASEMSEKAFDKEAIARLVPMKRAGTPEEVADLASFLSSDRAAYISGQVISINGGMI